MLGKKAPEPGYDDFWQEYEEKTGEKILTRGLGKYVSGWDNFDKNKWSGIWGLVITSSGGFRFHHFPQNSWIDAFTSFIKSPAPKEKTIFIPREKITSSEYIKETKWWKKLFNYLPPQLVIKYTDDAGSEKRLRFLVEYSGKQPPVL
ncbi:MAG: hypothetical protein FWD40_01680 [Treponema sp.]|nr:hypothetical protein [Treponema sp.]